MLDVSYDPKGSGDGIYVLWKKDSHRRNEVSVYGKNLYAELKAVRQCILMMKFVATSIYVHIPKEVTTLPQYALDHVVSVLIESIIGDKMTANMNIVFCHTKTYSYSNALALAIRKRKRTLGAQLFAMIPSNVATPEFTANTIADMFTDIDRCRVTIMDHNQLVKEGFGLLLGVGESSKYPPKMVVVERRAAPKDARVVAIAGKGITFDSGGLSIKPIQHMIDMKYDKIGAVYGATALLLLLEDPTMDDITFVGAFPLAENAVSDRAMNPGDVVKSYSKISVEIVDPDAEGRLILADAFGYLQSYHPNLLVDVATLTGHASIINCWHAGYYYASDKVLRDKLEDITNRNGERMLAMPTWNDYDDVLKSHVADIVNSPLKCSDSFVAALFLKRFVPKRCSWVHIDLANESDTGCPPKGHGVRTIVDLIGYWYKQERTK